MPYKTVMFNDGDMVNAVKFIQDRMPTNEPVSNYSKDDQFFGVMKDDDICVVYGFVRVRRDFSGKIFDMEFCIAANKGVSVDRHSIQAGFDYPFKVVGCRRVTAYINANNTKSLSGAIRIGFKKEGLMKDASASYDGVDIHVLGLTVNQWKSSSKKWRYRNNGR